MFDPKTFIYILPRKQTDPSDYRYFRLKRRRRKRSSTDYPLFHPYKDEQGRRIEVQDGTDKNSRIGRKLGRESRKVPSRIQFSRDQATRSVVALEIDKLKRLASPDYRR